MRAQRTPGWNNTEGGTVGMEVAGKESVRVQHLKESVPVQHNWDRAFFRGRGGGCKPAGGSEQESQQVVSVHRKRERC